MYKFEDINIFQELLTVAWNFVETKILKLKLSSKKLRVMCNVFEIFQTCITDEEKEKIRGYHLHKENILTCRINSLGLSTNLRVPFTLILVTWAKEEIKKIAR